MGLLLCFFFLLLLFDPVELDEVLEVELEVEELEQRELLEEVEERESVEGDLESLLAFDFVSICPSSRDSSEVKEGC